MLPRTTPTLPTRFVIVASTGQPIVEEKEKLFLMVDLSTLTPVKGTRIVIDGRATEDHTLGWVDSAVNTGRSLMLAGPITGANWPAVQNVLAQAAKGHRWEASIYPHWDRSRSQPVGSREVVRVNDRSIIGPAIVAKYASLRMVSIVPLGADTGTEVFFTVGLRKPSS